MVSFHHLFVSPWSSRTHRYSELCQCLLISRTQKNDNIVRSCFLLCDVVDLLFIISPVNRKSALCPRLILLIRNRNLLLRQGDEHHRPQAVSLLKEKRAMQKRSEKVHLSVLSSLLFPSQSVIIDLHTTFDLSHHHAVFMPNKTIEHLYQFHHR